MKNHHSERYTPKATLQFDKYIMIIIIIWGYSMILPFYLLYWYYLNFIESNLKDFANFWLAFSNKEQLLIFLITPFILILIYLIRLLCVIFLSKISIKYCNIRSPIKELISAKGIGKEEARDINYYHIRGVILRYLKWEISKSAFPWLMTWAFNFVGVCNYGKGTVLEDQFYTQEFIETGKNVHVGQGSIISSHLVEGKYGAITLKKVYIGENSTIGVFNPISPGTFIGPYTEFLPMSGLLKFQKVRGYSKYYGLPVSRISNQRYKKLFQIPDNMMDIFNETKKKKIEDREKKIDNEDHVEHNSN